MYHPCPANSESSSSSIKQSKEDASLLPASKPAPTVKKTPIQHIIFSHNITSPLSKNERKKKWWANAVIYEVYVRSFFDSSGGGIGDLIGLKEKLDYFTDVLGIQAIWITPVYPSPMVDFGYDISNFKDIDPIFGSLDDFKTLQKAMKERELKLIIDIVPNHTSDKHPWFIKSIYKEEPFTDYYIWKPAKAIDHNAKPLPPNNWVSVFGKSMWEWNDIRNEFYLHQFAKEQPDLNFRNAAVLNEVLDIFQFWLELGVDGFRVDAVPHLFEDPNFRDELPSTIFKAENPEIPEFTPEEYGYWNHKFTYNLPETLDVLKRFRDLCEEYTSKDGSERVILTEGYLPVKEVMKYYGTDQHKLAHFPFNFELLNCTMAMKSIAKNLYQGMSSWYNNLPPGCVSNWVIGNHDQPRIGTRLSPGMIDPMNIINLLLPGTTVTYYGEELGMLNVEISWKDTLDPSGINAGEEKFQKYSRDPCRTPMQWNASPFAGFTKGSKPWLPVHTNFKVCNVETEKINPESHLNVYRKLMQLRKLYVVQQGGLELLLDDDNETFGFTRFGLNSDEENDTILVLINFGHKDTMIDATCCQSIKNSKGRIILRTYSDTPDFRLQRDAVNMVEIELKAQQALVIEIIP